MMMAIPLHEHARMRAPILLLLTLLSLPLPAQPQVTIELVVTGLSSPVAITHAGDGRLFITEQRGRVVILNGTNRVSTPFLDVSSLVSCCGEQGLLSVAFHPHYSQNGFFFINYTDRSGDTVVARYRVSTVDPNQADPASALILMRIDQPFANHNGGQLGFGPDGYLYIGMGDGGSGGDPQNHGQTLTSRLGKMLRIDVDGGSPYAIPASNPFRNRNDAQPEIWSFGWRNPWRFSFDRENGDLWIADVGQGEWEEVNLQSASSIGGENYGWRRMEGTHCFNPSANCQDRPMVLPVIEYNHSGGACSVTGGYRYHGTRYPRLFGMYIYGDYCNGVIFGATPNASGGWQSQVLLDTVFNISSFGEDVAGEVYVADHVGGRLFRIVDSRPLPARRRPSRK
jgi:glucose/arabinose dehydrogenase